MLLAGMGVVTACGGNAEGSASADDIVVGTIMPLSGPQEPLSISAKSMQSYFDVLNKKGGIGGHKVVLKVADDQFNPVNTPAAARKLVEQENVLMLCDNQGSGPARAIAPYLQANGVPSVAAAGDSSLFTKDSTLFQMLTPYEFAGAHLARYAVEDFKAKRIAIVYSEDGAGLPWHAGAVEELAKLGVKPVAEVKVNLTAKDQSPAAAKLKESDADFVMYNHTAPIVSQLVRAAERIGYTPHWSFNASAMNQQLIELSGSALEGNATFVTQFPAPDAAVLSDYRTALTADHPAVDQSDAIALHGWISAKLCTDAIARAVDSAGGKVPTRTQVLDALKATTVDDELVGGLAWNDSMRFGPNAQHILELRGGKFVEVQGFKPSPDVATSK